MKKSLICQSCGHVEGSPAPIIKTEEHPDAGTRITLNCPCTCHKGLVQMQKSCAFCGHVKGSRAPVIDQDAKELMLCGCSCHRG